MVVVSFAAMLTAVSPTMAEGCLNEEARAEGGYSLGLPDCRAFEQVSPADKQDGDVTAGENGVGQIQPVQSSVDGEAVVYEGDVTSEGNGLTGSNEYLALRGPESWMAQDLSPAGLEATFAGFSSDLSAGLVSFLPGPGESGSPFESGSPPGYQGLYERTNGGLYRALNRRTPPNLSAEEFRAVFAGGSSDLSHVIFEANDALTSSSSSAPAAAAPAGNGQYNLYEWAEGGLRLVNVLPGNATTDPNAVAGSGLGLSHAISDDGSRVFWTDESNGDLYMRELQGGAAARTVQIDASVGGGGEFWSASSSGSSVLLTKGGHLYEYDVASATMSDLSPAGGIRGVVGASEDGSYVYFVAASELAEGATTGEDNLYLWHGGETRFIAALSPADEEASVRTAGYIGLGVWALNVGYRAAEVTPDGKDLVFMSRADLTGYDNTDTGALKPEAKGSPDFEIYLYEAIRNHLVCVSCDPNGARPAGESYLPPSERLTYQPTYITEDGRYLFFESQEALVSQDVNNAPDVYEYQSGHLHLISGGSDPRGAYFDAASRTGQNVYFTTRSRLVPQDADEQADIYDARVGGGFPAPVSVTECGSEACRGSYLPPPSLGVPSSTVLADLGPATSPPIASRSPAKPKAKAKRRAHKAKRRKHPSRKARRGAASRGRGKR